jgi:hypothetical protein
VIIKLMGMPGTEAKVRLPEKFRHFASAQIDGEERADLLRGKEVKVNFQGKINHEPWHKKIGDLIPCEVPEDAEALYEATCFAADSNALEIRSLQRSGTSRIPQVMAAREAFLKKEMFINRGIWDKNLFDGKLSTYFMARLDKRALRVDFGERISVDRLAIRIRDRQEHDLNPALHAFDEDAEAQVSSDLKTWTTLDLGSTGKGTIALAHVPPDLPIRYLRIHGAPQRIAEVDAYLMGEKLDRSTWRASNLFHSYRDHPAVYSWCLSFKPKEVAKNSYLAVALNGTHGNEGAYVALQVDGKCIGSPDRSVSFPSNTWEYFNVDSESDYTYYFPLEPRMIGKDIKIFVLILRDGKNAIKPEAWITAYPIPHESRELVLIRK